jgi:hypothetical protein
MYYANASATTASNGDNTFAFFDDFNDGTINNSKWTTSGPNNSESGGELRQVNTGGDTMSSIQSQSLYGENYSIVGRVRLGSASYTQYLFGFSDPESTGNDITLWNSWQNTSYSLFAYNGNAHAGTAGGASYVVLSSNYRNIYIRAEVIRAGSGNSILSVNGSTLTTRSGSYTGNAAVYFYGSYAANDNSYLDWVFVRKYASEPTSSFGAEQNN